MDAHEHICILCKKNSGSDDLKPIQKKGADGINEASKQRCSNICASAGDCVHTLCRKRFVDKKDIQISVRRPSTEGEASVSKKRSRSTLGVFNSGTDCFFCEQLVDFSGKCNLRSESVTVKTDTFPKTILEICKKRNDRWSVDVQGRLAYFEGDLHAADCVYHQSCSVNFRNRKGIPYKYRNISDQSKKIKLGRPENETQAEAFGKVCSYLEENEDELHTVSDLISVMNQRLEHTEEKAYSPRYLKSKLIEHFGESIFISEKQGQKDVVVLRESVRSIIRDHYECHQSLDDEAEKIRLIETAAKLIKSDIKKKVIGLGNKEFYPAAVDLDIQESLEYLPSSVKLLCSKIFSGYDELKIAAIGQCIMQACAPRAIITPMQIGLSVLVYSHTRSQFLLDVLSHLGFSSSYQEIRKFLRNASVVAGGDLIEKSEDGTVIFAADNIDHNVATLKGDNTFHGMGMMAAITPGQKTKRIIPRGNVTDDVVKEMASVNIYEYFSDKNSIGDLKFQILPSLQVTDSHIDLLWKTAWHLKLSTPVWSGTMKGIHLSPDFGKSSVVILPIINLQPNNMTCILSCMKYICHLSTAQEISPVLTFDQPLFWKASIIANDCRYKAEFEDMVIMLGSFHTLMNILGAIGHLMEGSGLEDVLQIVYGANTVKHILTGKAVSRAFRGHMLVDSALSSMLLSDIFSEEKNKPLAEDVLLLYDDLQMQKKTASDVEGSESLHTLNVIITEKRETLKEISLTSELWSEYQSMVSVARKLVQADRSGSWSSHLEAIRECLPVFAAAGHTNYLKSAYLYLQTMRQLPSRKPHIFASFQKGFHVVHRSDTPWSGLGCDLVIEQVLMRSIKTNGGLTRGSGLSECMRALWVLSMPATCEFSLAMQALTRTAYSTSEQHKEMHRSRQMVDREDGTKVLEFLKKISPFTSDPTLRNIVTERTFDPDVVNVQKLLSIGEDIVKSVQGKDVFTFSFKRKDRVHTLASSAKVKINSNDEAAFDPALLFQRLIVAANNGGTNLVEVLNHELCPFPPSLFETSNLLRKTQKSKLANAIYEYILKSLPEEEPLESTSTDPEIDKNHYVLDGGSLLHRVPWKQSVTFDEIASSYADFTCKKYGRASVVFDGYNAFVPSIKDSEHRRRGVNSKLAPTVNLTPETIFIGKKEKFLLNTGNKSKMISLIGNHLQKRGCKVIYTKDDADVSIAREAVHISQQCDTVVVGEDTDLLILLLYHATDNGFSLHFRSDIGRQIRERKIYNILSAQRVLGEEMCRHLLFFHAYTGCDSTSYIHGIGKASAFKKLLNSEGLKEIAHTFCEPKKSQAEIEAAGRKAMLLLFGGRKNETLQELRHRIFKEKVASSKTFVKPEMLPPTESAVKYHSLRCYYQVLQWKGEEYAEDACTWGWFVKDKQYFPNTSDLPPAPKSLLSIIRCKCTTSCENLRCSCKKIGLPCTDACGLCQEKGCKNALENEAESSSEDSDIE